MGLFILSHENAYALISFIKTHKREDIPDDVWDICMRLQDWLNDFLESAL